MKITFNWANLLVLSLCVLIALVIYEVLVVLLAPFYKFVLGKIKLVNSPVLSNIVAKPKDIAPVGDSVDALVRARLSNV